VLWEHLHLQEHLLTVSWQQLQTLLCLTTQQELFRVVYVHLQAAFLSEVRKLPHDFQSGQVPMKNELPQQALLSQPVPVLKQLLPVHLILSVPKARL